MTSSTKNSTHGPGDEEAIDDEGLNELPVNPDESSVLVPDEDGVGQVPS